MLCFVDNDNDGASDDSNEKVGEIRFVPEDKSKCKDTIIRKKKTFFVTYIKSLVVLQAQIHFYLPPFGKTFSSTYISPKQTLSLVPDAHKRYILHLL